MSPRVLLMVNRDKPRVRAALDEVRSIIAQHGELAAELDANDGPLDDAHRADLIMVLGGDGTFLAQVRRCADLGLPMMGVNFGNLGFLAEFDLDSLRAQAKSLLGKGEITTTDRLLIACEVLRGKRKNPVFAGLALNDWVITAGAPFRLIEIQLVFDGTDGPLLRGDGLIVSSPTGSTGYSVSAGGPIVAPGVEAMAITPIAAHSLGFRPLVVPTSTRLELILERANAGIGPGGSLDASVGTTLVQDGQVLVPLEHGDRLRITRHPKAVRLVRNPEGSYWRTLMRKMHWATPPSP
ncbi:MAG: NAD(+)/NADH kinase [Phycisphaerales bacterium]|nr:NAD(+)/NADH kinase [Phycisphaerales bacterium]